jgi:hypothetical protein
VKANEQKIVVCCPHAITGGPELLHQLVHELRKMGQDAQIAYYPFEQTFACPEPYKKYDAPQGPLIDATDTFVVVPETATWIIKRLKKARVGVWWLSVDYYFLALHQSILKDVYHRFRSLVRGYRGLIRGRVPLFRMRHLTHFTQSHYAERFLAKANISSTPLTDYLGSDHLTQPFAPGTRTKEDIIAFNPKKGQKQTRALMRAYPSIRFVPIQNMTPKQVAELLGRAKVYVDFGHHPGKDRPPREAAMAGCCVITGRAGSARYHEDVAIPDKYKLDDGRAEYVKKFGELIEEIFGDFESHAQDFDDYRSRIIEEPATFKKQVADIFGY